MKMGSRVIWDNVLMLSQWCAQHFQLLSKDLCICLNAGI